MRNVRRFCARLPMKNPMQQKDSRWIPTIGWGCGVLILSLVGGFVLLFSLLRGGCTYPSKKIDDSSVRIASEAPMSGIEYFDEATQFTIKLKDPNRDLAQLRPIAKSARLTTDSGRSYPLQLGATTFDPFRGQHPTSAKNVWVIFYFQVHDPNQPSKNFGSLPPGHYTLSFDLEGSPPVTHFSASFMIHKATKSFGSVGAP